MLQNEEGTTVSRALQMVSHWSRLVVTSLYLSSRTNLSQCASDSKSTDHHTDTIVATQPYNHSIANPLQPSLPLSMNDNMAKIHKTSTKTRDSPLPQPSFSSQDRNSSTSGMISTRCSTCANAPAPGSSLSRCSRCKNAFYCSKTCQKTAWRSHKFECEPIGSTRGFSPSSAMNTPDISTPASPVAHDVTLEPSIMLNVSAGEAASAPFTETHVHRLPQSSAQWHLDYTKYKPSFQIANVSMLGDYLEDAYRLYADEHGGFPSNFDVALDEYRAYINAVSERVELPFILDHVSKVCCGYAGFLSTSICRFLNPIL